MNSPTSRNDDEIRSLPRDEAISRLLAAQGDRLYGLGLKLCGSASDAEDLVQETFLQAYRKWEQFEGRSAPTTWLYTIASRICQRMHRKRAGEPQHVQSLETLLPFGETGIPVIPEQDPEFAREARDRVERALASLPPDYRMPLVLKEIVGLSLREVGAVLDLPAATVKTRVHRGRLQLRKALLAPLSLEDAPAPAYSRQMCLDLLHGKQDALDRGVDFPDEVICERCQSVFATLDLTRDICQELAQGQLPRELRERLLAQLSQN